jgi:hypothetical protein
MLRASSSELEKQYCAVSYLDKGAAQLQAKSTVGGFATTRLIDAAVGYHPRRKYGPI